MAILISIPAGVMANQEAAQALSDNLSRTVSETEASINQTLTQITCTSSLEGFGFAPPEMNNTSPGNMPRPSGDMGGDSTFDPSQFGGGQTPGRFGGGSFGGGEANPMNESLYVDISEINGVAAVAPILQATQGKNVTQEFMGRSFSVIAEDYVIEGIPLTSELVNYNILPTNITYGRNLQAGDSGVVVLSENNTVYFDAEVGDTITILDKAFTVVGIHGTSGVSNLNTLYMNLSDAQTITNNTGYVTSLKVFATDSSIVSQVASSISTLHSELTVQTAQDTLERMQSTQANYETALANAEASLAATQATATQEIIVVAIATSLIVLFVMLYTVRERTKEIGTLKAIGFSNRTVMGQFMLEGVLLSAIAGAVGIAIGTVAAPTLASLLIPTASSLQTVGNGMAVNPGMQSVITVSVNPQLMLIVFAVAITLGTLGSLYPAWRAAKIRPAEAMRYE